MRYYIKLKSTTNDESAYVNYLRSHFINNGGFKTIYSSRSNFNESNTPSNQNSKM